MNNLFNIIFYFLRSLCYIKRIDDSVNNNGSTWNNQNYENEEEVLEHEDENHAWEDLIQEEDED